MKRMQNWLVIGFLGTLLGGCGTSSPVVATIGNEKITLEDFENSYAKNNGGWTASLSSTPEDRQRFLDLLVKFRLKVEEAKDRGLANDSSVRSELDEYRLSVAQSYMIEKELINPHVKEMYDHKCEEIHAAHIFFRLPQNPTPADTLAAYNSAMKVISLLPKVSFDSLASEYSQDPQTAQHGGDVGWIIPTRIARDIENAAYSMKEGEISRTPVRSPFGYHILRILKRQPAKGGIRLSHILKRFARDLSDTAAVRDTMWLIYNQIKSGTTLGDLAKKFSDDPTSNQRGGDIGYYEREALRPDIVNLLFNLPVDSITTPYRQPYGYHIFEVTGRRPLAPFTEVEKDLRTEYQQRFYQQDYADFVKNLRRQYGVTINDAVRSELRTSFDTTKTPTTAGWSDTLSSGLLHKTLLTCAGKNRTVKDFVSDVAGIADFNNTGLRPSNVDAMVERVAGDLALKAHALAALDRYPELKSLMDEYLDGILLYRIEQDEVWKKIAVNDSLLRGFYDTTKEKYRWPDRVNFAEIFVLADSAKKAVQWKLAYGEDFLSVAEEYTSRPGYREKLGIWGLQPYDLNALSQRASKMPVDSVSEFFQYENGWSIIKVVAKDSSRVKSFDEAGPELASAYQEQASKVREQEWIDSLRKKYGVTLNTAVLAEAFKKRTVEKK
ncbi:MAG TPA: peptidylprolyl isomerase [Bacteroidota bacterium]